MRRRSFIKSFGAAIASIHFFGVAELAIHVPEPASELVFKRVVLTGRQGGKSTLVHRHFIEALRAGKSAVLMTSEGVVLGADR